MKTIDGSATTTYEIKRSKFICYINNISNVSDADDLLTKYRKEYADATHICYAYIINSPVAEKCSDDGEPSGTAGKPMLEMLKKQKLSNVLVVVIRYFGGIKLGAGGLVRAYANAVRETIDGATMTEIKMYWVCQIIVSLDKKYSIESNNKIKIINTDYSQIADKIITIKAAVECDDELLSNIKNIANDVKIEQKIMM